MSITSGKVRKESLSGMFHEELHFPLNAVISSFFKDSSFKQRPSKDLFFI